MKHLYKLALTCIFICSFGWSPLLAERGDKTNSIHTPEGGSPVVVGTSTAIDSIKLDPLGMSQQDYNLKNRISFGVDLQYGEYVAAPELVEVSIHVESYDVSNTALATLNFKLNISNYYQDTVRSIILDKYEFTGAYRMIFRIDTIRVNGSIATTLPKNLYVQGDIFVERYTTLNTSSTITSSNSLLDNNCDSLNDNIRINWYSVYGAEQYQIEFAFITDYGPNSTTLSDNQLKYDFKHNSTRVSTTDLSYDISLVFERGWLVYRIRPVGVDISDPSHLIFGAWNTSNISGTVDDLASSNKAYISNTNAHELSLNWQYSASYAEQGKHKEVISYFDGTNRNRQSVTKINTDNNVIVGETIYDYQGRPAITVLPTPVPPVCTDGEPVIKYYPDYNLNIAEHAYSKSDFDVAVENECEAIAAPMSTTSGSSNYYSPSNPNQQLQQGFVPDAEEYPFQQTQYTPDLTGRISVQSGVGSTFKMGSGKESKYIYSNPNQLELNRLFGAEVGYSNHYQKNAVIDPNGQVSVSYINLEGKVIATALAGASPTNLDSISHPDPINFEVNNILPDGSNQEIDQLNRTVTFSSSFLVTSPTNVIIDYGLTTIPMKDSCLQDICVDCVYELDLSLKDECGNDYLSDTLTNKIVGNFILDTSGMYVFHSSCTDSTEFNIADTAYLTIGKYTISKTLKILDDALYSYMHLIDSSECVLNYDYFLNEELQKVDTAACIITCETCYEQLGTLADYLQNGLGTVAEYYAEVKSCDELCDKKISDCEMYLNLMKIDVSPGGQYGIYFNPNTGATYLTDPLSVYNENNYLISATGTSIPNDYNWRHPQFVTPNGIQNIYADDAGQRSKVYLTPDLNNPGAYLPAPLNPTDVQLDPITNQYFIYPEQLQSVMDFINLFEISWGLSLVVYHPEYCYYESCILYEDKHAATDVFSSSSFDELLLNTNTFSQAQAHGFINSSGQATNWFIPNAFDPTDSITPWDPFVYYSGDFTQPSCTGFDSALVNKYLHYQYESGQWYTMPEIAAYTARCASNLSSAPAVDCFNFGQLYNGVLDTTILNTEWKLLKAMYMSAKQAQQQDLADCKALRYCYAFNGCIGADNFSFFPEYTVYSNPLFGDWNNSFPYINALQPCYEWVGPLLYKYKTKRFSNHKDAEKEDANSTSYELYLQTGQCPNAFALQGLLAALAGGGDLTSTSFDLNSIPQLSALFQANNSFNNPGQLPSLEYAATISGSTLTATWTDVSTSTIYATLTLNKTATQSWSDFTNVINLSATGNYTFTADVVYSDLTAMTLTSYPITGSITYFKLDGCTFSQECKPNQLALDLLNIFNVLVLDSNVQTTSPVLISPYYSPTLTTSVDLATSYIENAANVGSNVSWEYIGSNTIKLFDASVGGNDGLYIRFTSVTNPYFLTLIESYGPIVPTGDYTFDLTANLPGGTPVVYSVIMYQIHNGDTLGIPAGKCDLPIPNQCQGLSYDLLRDLKPLLNNVLVEQNYNDTISINLYASIYMTPAIQTGLPFGIDSSTSVDYGDTLIISSGDCDMILVLDTGTTVTFSEMISMGDFQLTGTPGMDEGYTNFTFMATFVSLGDTSIVPVYGTSCLSMKDCHPCPEDTSGATIEAMEQLALMYDPQEKQAEFALAMAAASSSTSSPCTETVGRINYCIDEFNTSSYPDSIPHLTESDVENYGWCECGDTICGLLDDILANYTSTGFHFDSIPALFAYLQDSADCSQTCYNKYQDYLDCVNHFGITYEGMFTFTAQDIISYSDFEFTYGCGCVDSYCNLLDDILQENIPFETQEDFDFFISYERNCYACLDEYDNYLDAITAYNGSTTGFLVTEIMPYELFSASGYCFCAGKYGSFLESIITDSLEFSSQDQFDLYTGLERLCDDVNFNGEVDICKQAYADYLACTQKFAKKFKSPTITVPYLSSTDFDSLGLCNCVTNYCSSLNEILVGIVVIHTQDELNNYMFSNLNCNIVPPCAGTPGDSLLPVMPTDTLENDCIAFQVNIATTNAQNHYQAYLDSIETASLRKYVDYCLKTQEYLYNNYSDGLYHFTLYYYDAAGNLIKTIPPEGVDPLPITSTNDALNIQINNDRANGLKTVFTSHRLQTRYEYNSLNQLVAQYTPDADAMDIFEMKLPNGLNNLLVTDKIQMINGSLGYLAGHVSNRAYLYRTTDGGTTWSRMYGLVGADLKKVQMMDGSLGIAIGEAGTVVKTTDGGNTWDLIETWNTSGIGMIESLNDIAVINPTTAPDIMIVGDNELIVRCTNFTSTTPTFTITNTNIVGNVLSVEVYSGLFYCTSYDPSEDKAHIYYFDTTSSAWIEITDAKNNNFSDIDGYASNVAYATDNDGRIYFNADLTATGSTWMHQSSNLKDNITHLRFFSQQQGIAIVNESGDYSLHRTVDGAHNWTLLSADNYKAISATSDRSIIGVAGDGGLVGVLGPYNSGADQVSLISFPNSNNLSTIWIEKEMVGGLPVLHVIVTDDQFIYYTKNAFVPSPVWEQFDYTTIESSLVAQVSASLISGGVVYGVATTADGKLWRIVRAGASQKARMLSTSFIGTGFDKLTGGTNAFYVSATGSNSIRKVLIDSSFTIGSAGSLSHTTDAMSFSSGNLLCANQDGDLSVVSVDGSGYFSTTLNQTNSVHPDKLNVLKTDPVTSTLTAFGNDGLAYVFDATNNLFKRMNNPVNENIYAADLNNNALYFVGENGLAKSALLASGAITQLSDMLTTASLNVSQTLGNVDLHGVALTPNQRLYVVGDNGTLLYAPSTNPSVAPLNILSQTGADFYDISLKYGSSKAMVVGENAYIHEQTGIYAVQKKDVFIPTIYDVHFANASSATITADNFTVRSTSNGGGTWDIVKPTGAQSPTDIYNKVWTLASGKSLLLGNGSAFLYNPQNGSITTPFTSTDTRALCMKPGTNYLYMVDNTDVKRIDVNSIGTPVSVLATPNSLSGTANALSVFDNGDFVLVGDAGYYAHYDATGTLFSYTTGLPSGVDFYDLAFKDHLNGIIVGDNGAFYYTTNQTVSTSGYLNATSWTSRVLSGYDPLATAACPIYQVEAASFSKLVIGGVNPTSGSPFIYPYIRTITDASGRYTQLNYYDRLGRIAVSQNGRQLNETKFSYTVYDFLGRPVEVGEKTDNPSSGTDIQFKDVFGTLVNGYVSPLTMSDTKLNQWINDSGARKEVTHSYYDAPVITGLPSVITADMTTQRGRIVHVSYEAEYDGDDQTFDHATHYVYDIHGNVKTLLQDNSKMATDFPSIASQRFKRMDYVYDLISGNVHRMSFQNGEDDQWHHAFVYDADNRIQDVYTNTTSPLEPMSGLTADLQNELSNNSDWQHDARYYYYAHGPLSRVEIGQNTLQGEDYFYTLQGWLKGVNSSVLDHANDPGYDSNPDSLNAYFGKDVFGFGLNYFDGDYTAINAQEPIASINSSSHAATNSADLYNGNIRFMQTALTNPTTRSAMPMLNAYKYDQLNRIKASRSYESGLSSNIWNPTSYGNEYFNAFTFDALGNILTQERYKQDGTQIDDLRYQYEKDGDGRLVRNRLYHLNDAISSSVDATDIDDMGTFESSAALINTDNNYEYDAQGRLVKDKQEEIDTILWTVTSKVRAIIKTPNDSLKNIYFDYDALGNQIAKHIYNAQTLMLEKSTYYILDAQGNQLSVYEHSVDSSSTSYYLTERNIYGKSRLGTIHDTINLFNPILLPSYGIVGNRFYELTDHRNNVYTVINDIKIPLDENSDTYVDGYLTGIVNVTDFSPFNVELDGRTIERGNYRYSVQGQEHHDEIKGKGNYINYKYRGYDPRIGRLGWATDPLAAKYPYYSPYQFSGNRVIDMVELEGLEPSSRGNAGVYLGLRLSGETHADAQKVVDGMTEGERKAFASLTKGTVIGGVVALDIFVTKGWASRIYFGMALGQQMNSTDGYNDAMAKGDTRTAAIKKEEMQETAPIVAVGFAGELFAGALFLARENLAIKWMGSGSKTKYIDIAKPVYTTTIKEGTELIQYRVKGAEGTIGNYFAPVGTKPAQIGINPSDVVETLKLKVTTDTRVLVSSHTKNATYYANESITLEGGGTQYFSKSLKENVTITNP